MSITVHAALPIAMFALHPVEPPILFCLCLQSARCP